MADQRRRPLKVGLIGCGKAAEAYYLPELVRNPAITLAGLCDANAMRLAAVGRRFKINEQYQEANELLASVRPDAVFIVTPPPTHLPLILAAARARSHIFVEKPIVQTIDEFDAMMDAVTDAGVAIGVDHNMLFSPSYQRAMSEVRSGRAGELISFSIRYTKGPRNEWVSDPDHWSHKMPGGIIGEALTHPLYLAVATMGQLHLEQVLVRKVGDKLWVPFDELRAVFSNGEIVMSANAPREEAVVSLYGTRKDLHFDLWSLALLTRGARPLTPFGFGLDNLSQAVQLAAGTFAAAGNSVLGRLRRGSERAVRAWIDSLTTGKPYPVSVQQMREVTRLFEAICALAASNDVAPTPVCDNRRAPGTTPR